ncbi:hypothetical protein F0L68_39115 [Solihabitans fulvus]|uniref:Uncharacterized protein n=1 Tax=Solihabitans fulvus TaxID=1892852 RepID=A0A5B2WIB0_9PSEU|nr:hypothetical protein [Solihabitans fulvus]KAA2250156.1 hypothetical protein F0L68_39115 [Solihabitans fulvus]
MSTDSAAGLLHDLAEYRARARRDRHGYWLPLLVFGVLILAAPLVYLPPSEWPPPRVQVSADGLFPGQIKVFGLTIEPLYMFGPGNGREIGNPMGVSWYWFGVVVLGLAGTVGWYRWRARRVGVETPTRLVVLAGSVGLLFLLGVVPLILGQALVLLFPGSYFYSNTAFWISVEVFVLAAAGTTVALWVRGGGPRPAWRVALASVGVVVALMSITIVFEAAFGHGHAPLLLLSVALLAVAAIERSAFCAVIAALFTAAALLANLYNMENVFYRFGFHVDYLNPRGEVFANLLLPAAVLIVGGGIAAWSARKASRRE